MSKYISIIFFCLFHSLAFGQNNTIEKQRIEHSQQEKVEKDSTLLKTPIPSFKNKAKQQWANSLFYAANKAIRAAIEGSVENLDESVTQITELNEKIVEFQDEPEYYKLTRFYNDIKFELESFASKCIE